VLCSDHCVSVYPEPDVEDQPESISDDVLIQSGDADDLKDHAIEPVSADGAVPGLAADDELAGDDVVDSLSPYAAPDDPDEMVVPADDKPTTKDDLSLDQAQDGDVDDALEAGDGGTPAEGGEAVTEDHWVVTAS